MHIEMTESDLEALERSGSFCRRLWREHAKVPTYYNEGTRVGLLYKGKDVGTAEVTAAQKNEKYTGRTIVIFEDIRRIQKKLPRRSARTKRVAKANS